MSSLATYHVQQMERVTSDFFEDGDGLRAVARRTMAVDDIVRGRFDEIFSGVDHGVAAIAVGGYGRAELFPFSDIDLLLLFGSMRDAERHEDRIGKLIAALWDSKLQVSHSVRVPKDCTSLARDNTELHISMLDTRFVAGDEGFVMTLQNSLLPKFYLREQRSLVRSLIQKARHRHQSYGDTLYHLEPNIKEGPGGLRDYHLACWVAQLQNIEPGRIPASGEFLPKSTWLDPDGSKRFLFAVRCYLHLYYGRDRNVLLFDLQDSIAHDGAGKVYEGVGGAGGMMRVFYRNTRSVYRLALRLMDESSAPTNALVSILRKRKSRLSNVDFSVSSGRIYLKDSHLLENRPERVLSLFEFQARHGLALAAETERRIRDQLPLFRAHVESTQAHWPALKRILLLPHTYRALDAMREAGILYTLFPSFELVDCLVIRDFYHRYTVDEHTLVAVRVLKGNLPNASEGIDERFASLLGEIEHVELLHLALLYHDLGKGVEGRPHEETSAEMARLGMRRIGLDDPLACETVVQLVADHLKMSEVMTKRDLSELSVLEAFKKQIKTLERLKLLTLLTYADSVAVNPSVPSVWRKQLLWRMYRGINSIFQRDHGDQRIDKRTEADCLDLAADEVERKRLKRFLRGFPERYVRTHTPEEVCRHAALASALEDGGALVNCVWAGGNLEVLVLSPDRPFLFASLCAGITASGGGIANAEAFSNKDGLVLDFFRVPPVVAGELRQMDSAQVEELRLRLQGLAEGTIDPSSLRQRPVRVPYSLRNGEPPLVSFDNDTSTRATIFFVTTADRAKLLHDLALTFSTRNCDIDVVLSHTQGSMAMDTFYLTQKGEKLPEQLCGVLRDDLLKLCKTG